MATTGWGQNKNKTNSIFVIAQFARQSHAVSVKNMSLGKIVPIFLHKLLKLTGTAFTISQKCSSVPWL